MRRLLILPAVLWLAVPNGAGAADVDKEVRLALFGPGSNDAARTAAEKLRRFMDRGGVEPQEWLAAAEALDVGADDPLRAYGDIVVRTCHGETASAQDVRASLEHGLGLLDSLEYEAAIESFERAEGYLPCLGDFIGPTTVADLYFFHGLAAFSVLEDDEEARERFANALSAEPSRPWDDRYSGAAQQAYLHAGQQVLHAPPHPIRFRDPAGTIQEIRIDGEVWEGLGDATRDLVPGLHLLQWRTETGALHTLQLEVVAGGRLVLLTGAGFVDAVLDGGRDPDLARAVTPALRQLAFQRGAEQVVIVRTLPPQQVALFDPADGSFELSERERFRHGYGEQRARWGPRGGISLGLGATSIVSPQDDWDFQYSTILLVGEFQTVAGLYLDVAASLAIRRGEYNRESVVLLPATRIGLKYAFKLRNLRPFLGIASPTVMYGKGNVAMGLGALLGLAVEFPKYPALRIGIELFGGRAHNWCMVVTGQVGFYY